MRKNPAETPAPPPATPSPSPDASAPEGPKPTVPEIGGYKGPEPTRYGDWEHNGRCTDF